MHLSDRILIALVGACIIAALAVTFIRGIDILEHKRQACAAKDGVLLQTQNGDVCVAKDAVIR